MKIIGKIQQTHEICQVKQNAKI